MKKATVTLLLLIIYNLSATSQEYLIGENVQADTTSSYTGPNKKHYWHSFLGYNFLFFLNNQPLLAEPFKSAQTYIGMRYKYKLSNILSLGTNISYNNQKYIINQSDKQQWIDTITYNKEKLNLQNIGIDGYFRINSRKRGNFIGTYLDIGAFANFSYNIKRTVEDKLTTPQYGETHYKTIFKGSNYINRFNYGLQSRIGFNFFVINVQYRISNLFLNPSLPEFPKFSVGIELDIID